ncbi:unnamed protein product [Toxocara canis]|uniref:Uncharacterized protein n=1 Tax=Toxocara canis TaxID=6265 RepID=A0A183UAN7_TOXCA|nr:unnamed protein product [Toxocara canis]
MSVGFIDFATLFDRKYVSDETEIHCYFIAAIAVTKYLVDALAGLAWEATPSQETERGIAQRDKWAHLGCLSPCASTDHRQHTPSQNNSPKLRPPSWPHRGGLGPLQLHAQTKRCRQRSAKQLCGRVKSMQQRFSTLPEAPFLGRPSLIGMKNFSLEDRAFNCTKSAVQL